MDQGADMERSAGKPTSKQAWRLILAVFTLALALSSIAQTAKPDGSDHVNRVVLVSIPDRKLAVIEDGKILASFSVAVGAEASPSPSGEFQIVRSEERRVGKECRSRW